MADWDAVLTDWLKPFVEKLGHKKRQQMCPLYVAGLIGPGERKSVEPMAARIAPDCDDRLHQFISDEIWDLRPIEKELAKQADRVIGGSDAFLVIDDTSLPKKGGIRSASPHNMRPSSAREPTARHRLHAMRIQLPSDCGCSCRKAGQVNRSVWREPVFPRHFAGRAASRRSRLRRSIG